MEGNAGSAGEGGQRLAAIADEMICGRNDARLAPRQIEALVVLRQYSVEGRAFPVAGYEDGNIVLIGPRMPRRSTSLTRRARQVGPAALEGFEDEALIRLDYSAQIARLVVGGRVL